jgi:hypothetical protein
MAGPQLDIIIAALVYLRMTECMRNRVATDQAVHRASACNIICVHAADGAREFMLLAKPVSIRSIHFRPFRRGHMTRKQKPPPDLVSKAAKALKNPDTASKLTIRRMAAIVLDDQEYDPQKHRPKPTPKPKRKAPP